ncbi:hypothetical protein HMPREF0454_00057 [Hafnia alvei ATCC 51873]|uniref:Uncharacterized protein n=1 Tax=Hafnia alvei ATCC 51873 TaxID=1002364 RepID=G9Y0J9_HAFAL|nr:hypothetical protein HMPREF0454_00057 [Hafnia alvei ATCC 51873]
MCLYITVNMLLLAVVLLANGEIVKDVGILILLLIGCLYLT